MLCFKPADTVALLRNINALETYVAEAYARCGKE